MFKRLWYGLQNFGSISLPGKVGVVIGVLIILGILYGIVTSKKFRDAFFKTKSSYYFS